MSEIYLTPARVVAGASTDVLRALARERAPDPTVFDERQPFFWLSEISNDRMDAYYGYMDAATTLANFAADAATGVAILAGHNHRELSFGYSLTGSLDRAEARTRVLSDAYTLRGLTLGGVQTDSFVDGLRAGVMRDISVGFSLGEAGWYRCNVCGNDLQNYSLCRHWPGMTYEEQGADGVIRQTLATFTVIDGRLSEYSVVYDGATPSAGVLKIQEAARSGELDERSRRLLEQRYRMRLPDRRVSAPGVTISDRGQPAPAVVEEIPMELIARLRALFGLADGEPDDLIVERAATALEHIEAARALPVQVRGALGLMEESDLLAALPALRHQAADGAQYRADLTADALAEAVRALGAEAEERYAPVLAGLPLATVRQMRDDWRAVAAATLPGGRVTLDRGEPPPAATSAPAVPDAAFRA
jgi:hypothetical protein